MPQNTAIDITQNWTMLTDADVAGDITFQNVGGGAIHVIGTNGTTQPTAPEGLRYDSKEGELKQALASLFPGVPGVNRLWAKGIGASGKVFVSHA